MIKVTEKNRGLVFLGAIMIIGIVVMGGIMLGGIKEDGPVIVPENSVSVNFNDFKQKIEALKNENFNPSSYNTLSTEIDSYYQQELITKDAQIALKSNLTSVYSGLIYSRCEFFLTGNNLNTSTEVLSWLKQLENITARSTKTDYYRAQINAYLYYSTTLPKKVSAFISPGITNYNDQQYYSYKDEVNNMPRLSVKYKNNQKFTAIRKNLLNNLAQFNADWATGGISGNITSKIDSEKL